MRSMLPPVPLAPLGAWARACAWLRNREVDCPSMLAVGAVGLVSSLVTTWCYKGDDRRPR